MLTLFKKIGIYIHIDAVIESKKISNKYKNKLQYNYEYVIDSLIH